MRLLFLLIVAGTLSGCRFWYKPVPVANAIGEEKTVLAGDSLNVYREDRFEVYGPSAESVYDGYEQLNRAFRSFERYFGVAPEKMAIVLSADTPRTLDAGVVRAFHDRGYALVRYARPRGFRSPSRYGALGYGGVVWPIAPTAARVMLARFVDSQLQGQDGGDSAHFERLPVWFRAAVIHLVGEAAAATNDVAYVRDNRSSLLGLGVLLTASRIASADSSFDPSRRNDADDYSRLIGAESGAFGRFLIEREGPQVLGRLARGYLAKRPITDMIAEFQKAPRKLAGLEEAWRVWLDTRDD